MYIATKILLAHLASFTAPDLCDVVNPKTGAPTICIPHADGAPVYNRDVCCSDGSCIPMTTGGSCVTEQERFYCELGEVDALGSVRCYFEVPHYCDVYECSNDDELEIDVWPQEATLCCVNGICTLFVPEQGNCDPQDVLICDNVVTNQDGTVECLDGE
jgi:hypothetical protein